MWVPEYAIWGAVGGLAATLVKAGCIELPTIRDRRVYLGGLQGVLFGMLAGLIGDNSQLNALMWGIAGTTIIAGLVRIVETKAGVMCEPETIKTKKGD
jgi:hypothetical protein